MSLAALTHPDNVGDEQIIWEAADDFPLISVAPDRIRQVFLNLTLNALEAMPEGGKLYISTAGTTNPDGSVQAFPYDQRYRDGVRRLHQPENRPRARWADRCWQHPWRGCDLYRVVAGPAERTRSA